MTALASTVPRILDTPKCVWAANAVLGEGTLWSVRHQALFWVDILGQRLYRYRPATQTKESWTFDESISALAELKNGANGEDTLLVTLRQSFAYFNLHTQKLEHLQQPELDRPENRFNDGKCDAQGRFWAGTMDFACQAPRGALYSFDAQGSCKRHDDGYAVTNGPTWSLDGSIMYFNDTVQSCIYAFDVDAVTGTLRHKRLWLQFSQQDGFPDGMTTDAAGRLWIAHWGAGCVTCHHPETAVELARIILPTSNITNCAFGGTDLCTLYISSARSGLDDAQLSIQTLAGALFSVELDSPGLPAFYFG